MLLNKDRRYPYETRLSVDGIGPEIKTHSIESPSAWFNSISLINNGSLESGVCVRFTPMDLWEEVLRIEVNTACLDVEREREIVCVCVLCILSSVALIVGVGAQLHLLFIGWEFCHLHHEPAALLHFTQQEWNVCVRCLNLWHSHSSYDAC